MAVDPQRPLGAALMTGVGYRLVLPPGWVRIPLRDDPGASVDAILDKSFRDLPKDKYGPIRSELRKSLMKQVDAARDNEGVDLYLPVERVHGATIAASFVVSVVAINGVETPQPEDVLTALVSNSDGASFADVDGAPAVRTETVVAPVEGADDESQFGSRRVSYLVAIPEGLDRWMSATFSTVGDGDPEGDVATLLIELFDAVMSTLRWMQPE